MISKNSKIVLKSLKDFKKDLPEMKVIEPFTPNEVIECENKDDFIEIINDDIDKYKSLTTQKLNRIFSIPGYRITKIKGEICLRCIKQDEGYKQKEDYENLLNQIDELHKDNENIKNAFNELSEQFEFIKQKFLKI